MMLYSYMPAFFIPNLFVMQFIYLKKLAEKYDLELPEIPNRANYKDRWFYYLDMCIVLNNFAIDNEIESASEFCAFLYDYELPMIKEEIFDGQKFTVTEYTMSEIIASVYEQIQKTGIREGILFIDEINCVSETLAPTMLQFLQGKTFGNQKVTPMIWLILS